MDATMHLLNFYDRVGRAFFDPIDLFFFISYASGCVFHLHSQNVHSNGAVNGEDRLIILGTRPLAELIQG